MRILFISHDATRSGAPLALLQILSFVHRTCKNIEFEVLLLCGGELEGEFKKICKTHHGWSDYSFTNRILRKFCKDRIDNPFLYKFKRGSFDCIYANSVVSFKKTCKIAKKIDAPIIGHVHEAEYLMYEKGVQKDDIQSIRYFITVSELAKSNLINNYGVSPNSISIQRPVSYWVDLYMKNKVQVSKIKINNEKNEFVIGLCANEGWCKGLDVLPLVIKDFWKKYDVANCKFVVIGYLNKGFQYKIHLELKKFGIRDNIIEFVGCVSNPLLYQKKFSVFLLISREDSFSLSAQEAALMETPIVGFRGVTGAAEWIDDGAGLLVPYMDFDKLSDSIYYLYTHEKERIRIGKRASEIVQESYKFDSKLTSIIHVISNCSDLKKRAL